MSKVTQQKRLSITQIKKMKVRGEKIPVLTAYDFPTARILDNAGIPLLLVGDSLGMVVLGYDSTIPVTLEDMIHHGKAVVRGSSNALVVIDMPFMSYQISPEQALTNAARLIQETGAQAVKLEGGADIAPTVEKLVRCGIPVMGHVGLTPQAINQLGGYRVVGKTRAGAIKLIEGAMALEEAGAFSVVLETVPYQLAKIISNRLKIPTIGIGAGVHCDGEVQVLHDIISMFDDFVPRHTRQFADVGQTLAKAAAEYIKEVSEKTFPGEDESFSMNEGLIKELEKSFS